MGLFSRKKEVEKEEILEKDDIRFWEALRPGSFVQITDYQGMEDAMNEGSNVDHGVDYELKKTSMFEMEANNKFIFLYFKRRDDEEVDVMLLVKAVQGEDLEFLVYFESDDIFRADTREEIIYAEDNFLFCPPESAMCDCDYECDCEIDCDPCDYNYVKEIEWKNPDGDDVPPEEEIEVIYEEGAGTIEGMLCCITYEEDEQPTRITDYQTGEKVKNTHMMAIETGGLDDDGCLLPEGGYVQFYFGCKVKESELEVYQKSE